MRIDVNIPKAWNEVSGTDLVKLAGLFLKHRQKPDFMARCFLVFSGWKPMRSWGISDKGKRQYWFKSGKQKFYIDADMYTTLVKKLDWLTAGFQLVASMPPVKGFKSCNVKLYNVTLEDYLNADNFYDAFVSTNNAVYLTSLFSVFYKPVKKIRFGRVSFHQKYAVFLWFSGVRHYLVNKYPYLFSGSSNSSENISPEETILNLLSALNNGDVTNNEKLFKTHVHECLHELNMKLEHSKPNRNV